jgi:hypothetical protein
LALREADERQLRQWVAAFGTPQQVSLRSRIVLAAATGQSESAIAREFFAGFPYVSPVRQP